MIVTHALVVALAATTAGCSFSYKLGSLFGQDKDDEKPEITTSTATANVAGGPASALPSDSDLAMAKAAAIEALERGGQNVSVPWENPETGSRGTITPIASAYNMDGFVCQDFLASYVHGGSESWLQGEACRIHQGRWEVRTLKPWKRS